MPYQSFPGEQPGLSTSNKKLGLLRLPEDMTGTRVLDIGCEEGFYSIEMKRRGASTVIGIDRNAACIERASARAPEIDFRCQSWDEELPEGKFDYVFLLSAMHYASDKQRLLDSIFDVLAPDGVFVLECGVVSSEYRYRLHYQAKLIV